MNAVHDVALRLTYFTSTQNEHHRTSLTFHLLAFFVLMYLDLKAGLLGIRDSRASAAFMNVSGVIRYPNCSTLVLEELPRSRRHRRNMSALSASVP